MRLERLHYERVGFAPMPVEDAQTIFAYTYKMYDIIEADVRILEWEDLQRSIIDLDCFPPEDAQD